MSRNGIFAEQPPGVAPTSIKRLARIGLFPKALSIILIVATASYLMDVVVAFMLPDLAAQIHLFLSIVPATAEIWIVLYLLIVGVRTPRAAAQPPVATVTPIAA